MTARLHRRHISKPFCEPDKGMPLPDICEAPCHPSQASMDMQACSGEHLLVYILAQSTMGFFSLLYKHVRQAPTAGFWSCGQRRSLSLTPSWLQAASSDPREPAVPAASGSRVVCPLSMDSMRLTSVLRTAAVPLRMLSTAASQKLSVRARACLHFFSIPTSAACTAQGTHSCHAALLHSCILPDLRSHCSPCLVSLHLFGPDMISAHNLDACCGQCQ